MGGGGGWGGGGGGGGPAGLDEDILYIHSTFSRLSLHYKDGLK